MFRKRFSDLQEEFLETSKCLRLAVNPEDKLVLLNKQQQTLLESKRALADSDPQEI